MILKIHYNRGDFIYSITSAYIHIPFCVAKCLYCDFTSWANQDKHFDLYVEQLVKEILFYSRFYTGPLKTIYFGGGTPSVLSLQQLEKILQALYQGFGWTKNAEITLELNPGVFQAKDMSLYKSIGFNRLSIGIQSLEDTLLHSLGRIHTAQEAKNTIESAFRGGFDNISCDLMFGVMEQQMEQVVASISTLVDYQVPHLSFYSLSIEENSYLGRHKDKILPLLPEEKIEREMYHTLLAYTASHGYSHYEISNVSLLGKQSRHNINYWQGGYYFGFGVGAYAHLPLHPDLDTLAQQNVDPERQKNFLSKRVCWFDQLETYLHQAEFYPAKCVAIDVEWIDSQEAKKEYMLLGFRLLEGVKDFLFFEKFKSYPHENFAQELKDLEQRGLIRYSSSTYTLTPLGLDMANQVFMSFV